MKTVQKAIIKKGGEFLTLLRSPKSEFFSNTWDFPGGKLEQHEDPFRGIEREVEEETSMKIKALKVEAEYEMTLKDILHKFVLYSTEIISGEPKISFEHVGFRWVGKNQILKLPVEPYIPLYFKNHE